MTSSEHPRTTSRRVWYLASFLGVSSLPVLFAGDAIPRAARLNHLAEGASAYFVPSEFGLLYLATPVVMLSACIFLLAPGLFLGLVFGAGRTLGGWLAAALLLDCAAILILTRVFDRLLESPLRGGAYLAAMLCLSLLCGAALLVCVRRGRNLDWPVPKDSGRVRIALLLAAPAAIWVLLLPKFLWEVFNGDGTHAYESARLLLYQPLPLWNPESGGLAVFPYINSMLYAYPTSWFIRLFAEPEVSARMPFLLYLAVVFALIVDLAEQRRSQRLGLPEQLLIWAALFVYTLTVGFSATYSPYFADFALPATQDTLLMVCYFAAILAFVERRSIWLAAFVIASCASLPNAPILFALLLGAFVLFLRPVPWRSAAVVVLSLVAWTVFQSTLPSLLAMIGSPMAPGEYELAGLIGRFRYLQLTDLRRIGFVAIPCGILPWLALVCWRWFDSVGRALMLVSLLYFALFYVQAYVSLHHFIPAMLLPLVAFWRIDAVWSTERRRIALPLTLVFAGVGLWLALPTDATPHTALRRIGASIEDRVGGYEEFEPAAFRDSSVLRAAIPYVWAREVPDSSYGAAPNSLYHYAHRAARNEPTAYVLQKIDTPASADSVLLAEQGDVALYLVDEEARRSHLAIRQAAPAGSPALRISRSVLFRLGREPGAPRIFDLSRILKKLMGMVWTDSGEQAN